MDFPLSVLIGPVSGLAISLFFCWQFLQKYTALNDKMYAVYQTEVSECRKNNQYLLDKIIDAKDTKHV